jgi:hypothetical protein
MHTLARTLLPLALFAAAAAGCATTSGATAGDEPRPARRDSVAEKVAHQAAFDLQCGEREIAVTKISEDMGGMMRTYGARGCNRQGTYKASCSIFGCTVMSEMQTRAVSGG